LFYGRSAFTAALFPLIFLVFCIPIPSFILARTIDFLRRGSADVAFILFRLIGMPVYRQGFTFTLPDLVIEVAPQCSGIRAGISLLILDVLAGHLFLRSWWRCGVLIIATIPILIFKNALRIGVLSYLAVHVDKAILASRLHREGGIPFFALGLIMIYPIFALLMRSEGRQIVPQVRAEVNL
jgi:exosortase